MRKLIYGAATAVVAALALAVPAAAMAATGPRVFTTDSAGFEAHGAQFRFVQDSVYIGAPAKFAAVDDGFSWETHLSGVRRSDSAPMSADINVGGDPQSESTWHAWADVNGSPVTLGGSFASLAGGQTFTESIYYNTGTGVVSLTVTDSHGHVAFGSSNVGTGISFRSPRVVGGIDAGSSFTAPVSPLKLGRFVNVALTTYSGHHGDFSDWYEHNKVFATSDGTSTGHVRAAPSSLSGGGSVFSVFIEP